VVVTSTGSSLGAGSSIGGGASAGAGGSSSSTPAGRLEKPVENTIRKIAKILEIFI